MRTTFARVSGVLKKLVPNEFRRRVKRILDCEEWARVQNVYHCTTHKAASTWMVGLLRDRTTFKYSGLEKFVYQSEWMDGRDPRSYDERFFSRPFPKYTIATRLYLNYSCFRNLTKPSDYRAFFVLRDPRDIVVSWYYSMKNTHPINGVESRRETRKRLREISKVEGLCWAIQELADYGLFNAQKSWIDVDDSDVRVFKYEDLTGNNQFQEMKQLFSHCTISIPDAKLRDLLHRHGFESTEKRQKGEEDRSSHRRKGEWGDWVDHFDAEVRVVWEDTVGKLPQELGYPSTNEVMSAD
jgi:hypothetical protein